MHVSYSSHTQTPTRQTRGSPSPLLPWSRASVVERFPFRPTTGEDGPRFSVTGDWGLLNQTGRPDRGWW